jgi:hypothetical protein
MKFRLSNCIDGSSEIERVININNSDIPILLKELKIIKAKMDELDYGQ